MKTVLYYFSGTGNSLVVAQDLAKELGDTSVIPIARAMNDGGAAPADKVGLVFPVYMWGLPLIVASFIGKMKIDPKAYYFAVTTYGGFPGATLGQADRLFRERGATLSAGFGIKMPGNYMPMYGAIADKKQQALFAREKDKIRTIAGVVGAGGKHACEKNNPLVNWLFSGVFYGISSPHIHEMDKSFFADAKCTSCGICAKVCPVGNITLTGGKPVWHQKCEQCLACLQWCPVEAIQMGKSTIGRRRYRHPEARADNFIFNK